MLIIRHTLFIYCNNKQNCRILHLMALMFLSPQNSQARHFDIFNNRYIRIMTSNNMILLPRQFAPKITKSGGGVHLQKYRLLAALCKSVSPPCRLEQGHTTLEFPTSTYTDYNSGLFDPEFI
jgi:hypothetical protein